MILNGRDLRRRVRLVLLALRVLGLRAGLHCLLAELGLAGPRSFAVRPPGCRHPVSLRVPSTDLLTYRQVFIDGEFDDVMVETPRTVVDAGANIGLVSVLLANLHPEARIIALEPDEENHAALRANVRPYANVEPLRLALWHQDEAVTIEDPGMGAWALRTRRRGEETDVDTGRAETSLRGVRVDTLMDELALTTLDLLKMDIEGAEADLLLTAGRWLDRVDLLVVELHERYRPGCRAAFDHATRERAAPVRHGEHLASRLRRGAPGSDVTG